MPRESFVSLGALSDPHFLVGAWTNANLLYYRPQWLGQFYHAYHTMSVFTHSKKRRQVCCILYNVFRPQNVKIWAKISSGNSKNSSLDDIVVVSFTSRYLSFHENWLSTKSVKTCVFVVPLTFRWCSHSQDNNHG